MEKLKLEEENLRKTIKEFEEREKVIESEIVKKKEEADRIVKEAKKHANEIVSEAERRRDEVLREKEKLEVENALLEGAIRVKLEELKKLEKKLEKEEAYTYSEKPSPLESLLERLPKLPSLKEKDEENNTSTT